MQITRIMQLLRAPWWRLSRGVWEKEINKWFQIFRGPRVTLNRDTKRRHGAMQMGDEAIGAIECQREPGGTTTAPT